MFIRNVFMLMLNWYISIIWFFLWYIFYFFVLNRWILVNIYFNVWIDFMVLWIYVKNCFWWMFYILGYFIYDVLDMYFNNWFLYDWGVMFYYFIVSIFLIIDFFKYIKKILKYYKCDINYLMFIVLYFVILNNDV